MAEQIKNLIAKWDATWPSPLVVSRQHDNGQFRVNLVDYPEPENYEDQNEEILETINFYLVVWMKQSEGGEMEKLKPIQLPGPYWLVSAPYTQLVQDIQFQFYATSSVTGYIAHSAKFKGMVLESLSGSQQQSVIPEEMWDAYKQYIEDKIIGAGLATIDPTLSIQGAAAEAKATGDALATVNGRLSDVEADLSNLSVDADMIDADDKKTEYVDYDGYTLQTSSYIDTDGSIGMDQTGLCATTGLMDISDVPDTLYVKCGSTVEGYTGRKAIVLKNTDNTYSSWTYSQLPASFCTKVDGVVTVNVGYLKNQGTRSKIGFNLTATDHYVKYAEITSLTHKALDWLNVGYSQIKDTNPPENLYNKTCSAFGGSTVSNETATITAVNQGIMTNPFVSNSNCVRVKAKITFTVPNVRVLLPYYANGSWNYGNILDIDEIESGVEFTFDFDASNYIVYQSAERFRLIFQTRTESGVSDYNGTITIASLSIQSLDTMRQSEYFNENFEQMMSNVFSGIDVAKTLPAKTAEIYTTPNGDRVVFGVGENNVLVAIPVVPAKTLFFGNSLLLGMNTTSANHQYVYGMCATAPDKDYCHLVMDTVTGIKSSATYERVHGAQFESLGTSDSFSALWNTTANTYTGQPLKNSFTSDLDLIIIQISDNINTADKRTAFAANVDTLLRNIRNASPNARLLWVYGWFSSADTNAIILSACQKWGIESLNIHPYNTPANQGVSGQSYIDGSGNTQTVSDTWITHPGDNGFSAIADAIIDKLGID